MLKEKDKLICIYFSALFLCFGVLVLVYIIVANTTF